MRHTVYIGFFILLLFTSCGRKSGRMVNNEIPTQDYSSQRSTNQTVSKDKPNRTQNTPLNAKIIMTGSEIFEKYDAAVFMVFTYDGTNVFQGSGFVIRDDGIAVSNYHVFEGTGKGFEILKFSNGNTYNIKDVIAYDSDEDIILFRIDANRIRFPFIPMSSIAPRVGEDVYAIGSPLGLENTFSSGEISQLRGYDLIQINVPIAHGSSGGALINKYGEAIGITTAGIDGSGANLNFAININVIRKYLLK